MVNSKTKTTRPPIITVMGHIDHGKTTLLDALRHTRVADKESGGITQHIGAYQIEHKKRLITFIDTPGHAAFAAMRSRGAHATDLVILVIDAVESVKPQTKECINHIQQAKVPFLVAINKMDLPNAIPEIVKKDLSDAGVLVEGYGGDIVTVPISAKTGKGLDQLLEMILLLADMQSLQADPFGPFKAVVIESLLDQQKGPVATIIVKNGTIKVGDQIQSASITGKVKALTDDLGNSLSRVVPGQPAQVLGFNQTPPVGSMVLGGSLLKTANNSAKISLKTQPDKDDTDNQASSKLTLKIILKADTLGTLEAITQNLGDEVFLIASGIGDISESDVLLAQSTHSTIIGFRVKTISGAKRLADIEAISIKIYSLIHQLLDDVQAQILKLLEPTIDETILGQAKITAQFTVKGHQIAGCTVESGKLTVGDKIHLIRQKITLADSKIKSVHKAKEAIEKAKKGEDCGISFSPELDFKPKDILIAFKQN